MFWLMGQSLERLEQAYAGQMPWLSDDRMWEFFGTRALLQASYGAAEFGECRQAVDRVGDGNADDWHREWLALADGLVETGDESAAGGDHVSARDAYLRATTYYRVAYLPLYGEPTDPRLRVAFDGEMSALAKYAPLHDRPVELVEIPFEDGTTFPGVLALVNDDGRPRATIVHTNGYDSTVAEMFVSHALAANARGYNVLLFDGPGQGRNLIHDGIRIRRDWENVVRPVIDYALKRPEIDADRIVLGGWSFGGWLAPRAAAFDHRLAGLWADPGQWDQRDAVLGRLPLSDEDKAAFPDIDPAKLIAAGAPKLYDAISADRKELLRFTVAGGSSGHCEANGRRQFHQRSYAWLTDVVPPDA